MTRTLLITIEGRYACDLTMSRSGGLTLTYDEGYRAQPSSTPLSVTMPLVQPQWKGAVLQNWLSNLLPDNQQVLDRWATQFRVSAASPFRLLEHVGRDVAGAVQFLRPDDEDLEVSGVDWLTDEEFAKRLAELRADPAAWTPELAAGLFSLSGVQAKIALRHDPKRDRWGMPYGSEATTHILKPYAGDLPHQALNEHLSLALAREVGLPAAHSRVLQVDDHAVVCVERYDRLPVDGSVVRVHQEDLCQALGLPPSRKYETDGGPGVGAIISLLNRVRDPQGAVADVTRFLHAQAFAWATGATDAHAKNYGLLLSGGQALLTPLYDVHSAAPYFTGERRSVPTGRVSVHLAGLAMQIGGDRRFDEVTGESWRRVADRVRVDPDWLLATVRELVAQIPAAVTSVVEEAQAEVPGADHRFLEMYAREVTRRAKTAEVSLLGRGPRRPRVRR